MWFKNIRCYRFNQPFALSADTLQTGLETLTFNPCGATEIAKQGWVSPLRGGDLLYHAAGNNLLVCLKKEEKMLPASVINDMLAEKVNEIEAAESRPVKKKEKDTLKEEIVHTLLPRAFSRYSTTFAYIALDEQMIMVDSSSANKADELVAHLRKSLGSLPVVPLTGIAASILTHWLSDNEWPERLSVGEETELREAEQDGGVVKLKNCDMNGEEIRVHLDNNKFVSKLSVNWDETLSCQIDEELAIRRIRFFDVIKEQNEDIPAEDASAKFDADFALMAGELNRFMLEVKDWFDTDADED